MPPPESLFEMPFLRRMLLTLVCLGVAAAGGALVNGAEAADPPPSLLSSIQVAGPLSFCGESVPIEDPEVLERLEKELMISPFGTAPRCCSG